MAMGGYTFTNPEHNRDMMLILTEVADCLVRDLRDHPAYLARSTALEALTRGMGALELYDRAGNDWTFARLYRQARDSFLVDAAGLQNSANIVKIMDRIASRKAGNMCDRAEKRGREQK